MTKAVTAAAIGSLEEEKNANWETIVKDALPAFKINDATLQNCITITDLLCHCTGMSWGDNLFIGTENNVLISEKDFMKYINSQTRLLPFRAQFSYNNIVLELAGKAIESLSGESYFNLVQSHILGPVGLDRTFLKTPPPRIDNVFKCYNALDDRISAPITCAKAGDDCFGTPGAAMRSCVRGLMKLYKTFLSSFTSQFATGKTSTQAGH